MVRPLSEYEYSDWRRLRPLLHGLKTARYRFVNKRYVRRISPACDLSNLKQNIAGKRVLVSVAFGDAEIVEWQVRLMRRHIASATHMIADNSREGDASAAIANVCAQFNTPYIRLPPNPWYQPSRSHGIALNWLWHNLIRPAEPEYFGFLDHDIFPTEADDPFNALATQDCFGVIRTAGARWFLWAGYCMYRFDRVRNLGMDFGQDWFNGMDTGGGNWWPLYRNMIRSELKEAATTFQPYKAGVAMADGALQWVGPWVHEVGQMVRPELRADRRQVVRNLLATHLEAAL